MKKYVLLVVTLFITPLTVQADNIYFPPNADMPNSTIPDHEPSCFQYVIHDQNLVDMTVNTGYSEKNKKILFFFRGNELTLTIVTQNSLVDPVEDPFNAYQNQTATGHDPIGVITKYTGEDWLALAVPTNTSVGCKYIYLQPYNK